MTKIRCTNAQARLLAVLVIWGPALCPREWGPNHGQHIQFRVKDVCESQGWIKEERYMSSRGGGIELPRYAITEAGRAVLRTMWPKIWQYYSFEPIHPLHI